MLLIIAGICLSIGSLIVFGYIQTLIPRDIREKTPFLFQLGEGLMIGAGICIFAKGIIDFFS